MVMKVRQTITLIMVMMSSSFFVHGQEAVAKVIEEKAKRNMPITLPELIDIEKADVVVKVSADGKISIKGKAYTTEALEKHLGRLVEKKQDLFAILCCDHDTVFKDAMNIIDITRAAGVNNMRVVIAKEKKLLDDEKNLEIPELEKDLNEKILEVSKDNEITIEGEKYTYEELAKYLVKLSKADKNQAIRIRGDGDTPYDHIVKTVDICRESGIWNISFATRKSLQRSKSLISKPNSDESEANHYSIPCSTW